MKRDAQHKTEFYSYIAGLALAGLLTAGAFSSVAFSGWSRPVVLSVVAATALVQILVHFKCFLHIDLSKSKRDDLQLILFTALLIIMMAGGTIWVLANLQARMM